jgi:hypothetical protein
MNEEDIFHQALARDSPEEWALGKKEEARRWHDRAVE